MRAQPEEIGKLLEHLVLDDRRFQVCDEKSLPAPRRAALRSKLLSVYRQDASAEVHAAVHWLLRTLRPTESVPQPTRLKTILYSQQAWIAGAVIFIIAAVRAKRA